MNSLISNFMLELNIDKCEYENCKGEKNGIYKLCISCIKIYHLTHNLFIISRKSVFKICQFCIETYNIQYDPKLSK